MPIDSQQMTPTESAPAKRPTRHSHGHYTAPKVVKYQSLNGHTGQNGHTDHNGVDLNGGSASQFDVSEGEEQAGPERERMAAQH